MPDRSFKEYINERFYNDFFSVIKPYVIEHRGKLEFYSRVVSEVDFAELSDIKVKTVGIDDRDGMRIAFDAVIEAEVDIKEYARYDSKEDTCYPWFMLSCEADLSKDLNDMKVLKIEPYNQKSKHNKPLSDSLVPISYKDDLDKIATDFLLRHYPEALKTPMAIDPSLLVNRLGLNIVIQEMTKDLSVFGQIFFADCDAEIYNAKTDNMEIKRFPAKTIMVDPKAFHMRTLGSVNNTIVHECVHWDKHRKAFELERLYNSNASQIRCLVIGGTKATSSRSATDWMEWQANTLAPRIQMPIGTFKQKAIEYTRQFQRELNVSNSIDVMEPVIDALANFFCVSRQAAKLRMIDAGYEEAIGTFTYIDGKYVKPHAFKKGSLQKDQTYCIDSSDAAIISFSDMRFAEQSKKGAYIYVDSHFCLNDKKYIVVNDDGTVQMTEYARLHIDECCLAFSLKIKAKNKYGEEFYKECVLFRDADSGIEFVTVFSKEANSSVSDNADAILGREIEIQKALQELPAKFGDALVYLMSWIEITVEDLAEKSLLSAKTIQRMRNNPDYPKDIDSVVAMCIGMSLPPELSYALIEKSGYTLRLAQSHSHLMYKFFLEHCYKQSVTECNEMLLSKQLPIMTGTE